MKKIISFEKNIEFPSMIGEITSISLDHTLKFIDSSNIEGEFVISGTYKMTEATTLEEKFNYNIPIEIVLTEKFDNDKEVSIDDFHYEIENDDTLKCYIDVLVTGVEKIELVETLERECDGDLKEDIGNEQIDIYEEEKEDIGNEQIDIHEEEKKDIGDKKTDIYEEKKENEDEESSHNISSLFESLSDADESFSTYSVYIFRKNDTLEKIMDKYKINMDTLGEYNDLSNIEIGTKIIIPSTNNE